MDNTMDSTVDFIKDLRFEDIPDQALESARLCLTDTVGCALGGIRFPKIRDLARSVSQAHPGPAGIMGTKSAAAPAWAAFVNTHAATYFDLDDGHRRAQGHPGGVIVPLALMTAARHRRSGKALLTAITLGYEIAVRSALIMRELGGPRKGSGAWSLTGAVAAAGRLSGMSGDQLKTALGLAEYYAPQAPQDKSLAAPSSMKEGMAWAAYTAVAIQELTALGFDAMSPFLADAPQCRDLGKTWEIRSVYRKTWACCRFAHPVLDGLTALVRDRGIDPRTIKSITVHSFEKALLLNRTRPQTPVAAMYSIPYAVGCCLARGAVGAKEIGEGLGDPDILGIADKVSIVEDPELTGQFPEKCLARITLGLADGSELSTRSLSAKGDPGSPYTTEELRAKFIDLAGHADKNRCQALYRALMTIDTRSPELIFTGLTTRWENN